MKNLFLILVNFLLVNTISHIDGQVIPVKYILKNLMHVNAVK